VRLPPTHAVATADASGIATARIGPKGPRQRWVIQTISIQATGTTRPDAYLYRGEPGTGTLIATSRLRATTPYTDDGTFSIALYGGEYVSCQFRGCSAGATCTMVVEGERSG
jgi:hypothetical protein